MTASVTVSLLQGGKGLMLLPHPLLPGSPYVRAKGNLKRRKEEGPSPIGKGVSLLPDSGRLPTATREPVGRSGMGSVQVKQRPLVICFSVLSHREARDLPPVQVSVGPWGERGTGRGRKSWSPVHPHRPVVPVPEHSRTPSEEELGHITQPRNRRELLKNAQAQAQVPSLRF